MDSTFYTIYQARCLAWLGCCVASYERRQRELRGVVVLSITIMIAITIVATTIIDSTKVVRAVRATVYCPGVGCILLVLSIVVNLTHLMLSMPT